MIINTYNYIKLKNIKETCFGCPTTFDGETFEGLRFYCRYRGGQMRFEVDGQVVLRCDYGEMFDGSCTWDEFKMQAEIYNLIIDDGEADIVE